MSVDPELQAFFAECDEMVRRLRRPAWNALVYFCVSLAFGVGGVKSLAIGLLAGLLSFVGYGNRWVERLGFAAIAVAVLVWLGALPPPNEWQNIATALVRQVSDMRASQD
jgi:hypothetical protein